MLFRSARTWSAARANAVGEDSERRTSLDGLATVLGFLARDSLPELRLRLFLLLLCEQLPPDDLVADAADCGPCEQMAEAGARQGARQ